jgi:hypothetical protein
MEEQLLSICNIRVCNGFQYFSSKFNTFAKFWDDFWILREYFWEKNEFKTNSSEPQMDWMTAE